MLFVVLVALFGVSLATHPFPDAAAAPPRGNPCAPLAIPNAIYEPPIAGYNSIADGGRVKITCATAYENHGASWVICQKGRWQTAAWEGTSAAPQCLASCSPPDLANAVFTPPIASSGLTRHGTRVTVGCSEGYEYVGDTTITCYYGQWTGLNNGRCYFSNESYCRDPEMVPILQSIINVYGDDPAKASMNCNYYYLNLKGIKADGLSYLGINPATPQKPSDRLAYYVPGITGSDAVYRCLVVPSAWNMTTPDHLSASSSICRVYNEEKDTWAYVFKVLYREGWGRYQL